jgi:hypothetical protein
VKDDGAIVGTKAELKDDAKSWIFEHTGQKIGIDEVITSNGEKVIVISIPGRKK